MIRPSSISLEFGPEVREPTRARIEYAFRVFAAVYNYRVIAAAESGPAIRCFYGQKPRQGEGSRGSFFIPALYGETAALEDRNCVRHRYAEEDFHLACGWDSQSGQPDWLGEIFLWLSSSQELGIQERDELGRIPYAKTIFPRRGLSPRKPHATLLMAWMEAALRNEASTLPKPPSPIPDAKHLVVCSHDIDFYFGTRTSNLARFFKNLIVAAVSFGDYSFFADNFRMLLQTLAGEHAGEYLPALVKKAAEGEYDFRSTLFVVSRHAHRRDPAYQLEHFVGQLLEAERRGFAVGVHGSYRSVTEERTLREEAQALEKQVGRRPLATRQHWLRFGEHRALFAEIERAGLLGDSTLGFSGAVGFRNGASFAFPPYNFTREGPHEFLEIPLVLMDGAVETEARLTGTDPQQLAAAVLGESRKRGWGGVSILWHNPVESIQVPRKINDVFWNCAKQQRAVGEKWMSMDQFLACSLKRYQAAGFLQKVRIDHENALNSEIREELAYVASRTTD